MQMDKILLNIKKRKNLIGALICLLIIALGSNYLNMKRSVNSITEGYFVKTVHVLTNEFLIHRELFGGEKGRQPSARDWEYMIISSDSLEEFRVMEFQKDYAILKEILKPNQSAVTIKYIRDENHNVTFCDVKEANSRFHFENKNVSDLCIRETKKDYKLRNKVISISAIALFIGILIY